MPTLPTISNPNPVTTPAVPAKPAATFSALFLQRLEITAPSPSAPWPMKTVQAPYDPATGTLADVPPTNFSTPDVKADAVTYPAFGQWIGGGLTIAGPFQVAKNLAVQWAAAVTANKTASAVVATATAKIAQLQTQASNLPAGDQSQAAIATAIAKAQTVVTDQSAIVTSTQVTITSASTAWATVSATLGTPSGSTPPEVTAAIGA